MKNKMLSLILLFLIGLIPDLYPEDPITPPSENPRMYMDAADVIPPKEYLHMIRELNKTYKFGFNNAELDLLMRLFIYESNLVPERATSKHNKNGTTDYGLSAINESNLAPGTWNFIERYWRPTFKDKPFDWRDARSNMFMGMSCFSTCLNGAGNWFDALVAYNYGYGNYKRYAKISKTFVLPKATKNIIEFVFQREYWKDNMNYHYVPTRYRNDVKSGKMKWLKKNKISIRGY